MPDNQYTLETCQNVAGALVVIDVCRAFTTAAFAFAAGAERILLAGTVEEALQLRDRFPGAIIMGESSGLPVPGFDLWNSPRDVSSADLTGKTVIQRTSAGTQGMVRSRKADVLVGCQSYRSVPETAAA
jgi:2-phosphosulfolactate phosphatase